MALRLNLCNPLAVINNNTSAPFSFRHRRYFVRIVAVELSATQTKMYGTTYNIVSFFLSFFSTTDDKMNRTVNLVLEVVFIYLFDSKKITQ